jgi:hypothetical protein
MILARPGTYHVNCSLFSNCFSSEADELIEEFICDHWLLFHCISILHFFSMRLPWIAYQLT